MSEEELLLKANGILDVVPYIMEDHKHHFHA